MCLCDTDDLICGLRGSEYPEDVQSEVAKIVEFLPASANHAASAVCLLCLCMSVVLNLFLAHGPLSSPSPSHGPHVLQ